MKLQKKDANGSKTYNVEECLEKISGINDTVDDINAKLKKVSGIAAGAEVNQEAFSNVAVKTTTGTTTIEADAKKDTLTIEAGNNIILTPDAESDKITIAAKDTVYNDTDIKNRMSTVEGKLNGSGSVTFSNVTTTGLTTKGEVEIYGATPHIDFHFAENDVDYTSRIIETASGQLNLSAANGVKINGKKTENEAVTLTVNANRITNLAYTAKYNELLGAVFVRIYGKINASMSVGYGYTVLNIGSHLPNSVAALSVKIGSDASTSITKKAAAYAQSNGAINIQPFDSDLNGYDIYITGFWFT